jgi:serine/threonine protein kinase
MPVNNNYSGQIIGNYLMMERLGSGEFGSVYRAQNRLITERIVAIKLINDKYVSSQEECNHFLNEARVLLKLQHPYILPVFDIGEHQGVPYIVLEFAPTGSLRNCLNQSSTQQLPISQSLTILAQIGQALHHAHLQHIIHRDLKPENILFNRKGDALLADFGIATEGVTSTNNSAVITGTPPYMAPEQFQGIVSKLSDQYALACIAYELVTGQRPFQANNFTEWAVKHSHEKPIPPRQINPALPMYVEEAILKAMAKERTQRFKDVSAFIAAVSPQGTYPPTPTKTVLKSPVGVTVLSNTDVTIGRSSDNTYVLNDAQVSGHHAVIRRHGQDYAITDLKSTNKTFVNGQVIPEHIAHVLKQGDNIRIGATTFEYTNDIAAPRPTATPTPTIVAPPPVAPAMSPPSARGQFATPVFTRPKKRTGLWVVSAIVGLLVIFAIGGNVVFHNSTIPPTPFPTPTPPPIPTVPPTPIPPSPTPPPTLPTLNPTYSGSFTDSNGASNKLTLVSVQENQRGSIRGDAEFGCSSLPCSGPPNKFGGTVFITHEVTFSFNAINNSTGASAILTFNGSVSSNNTTMNGTFTGNDGGSGTWGLKSS